MENEGSRDSVRNSESSRDLGTSSDRAMFNDESSGDRLGSGNRGSGGMSSNERGSGSSGERGSGSSSERSRSDSGGITNRELSREECEQDQLPERGRSESVRNRGGVSREKMGAQHEPPEPPPERVD